MLRSFVPNMLLGLGLAALVGCNTAAPERPEATVKMTLDQSARFIIPRDESAVGVTLKFTNTSAKDIAAIKGEISTRDEFGDQLADYFLVHIDEPIPAGATLTKDCQVPVPISRLIRLLTEHPDKVLFEWRTIMIK